VGEHVSVDAAEGVRAEPVVEDAISACCLVNYGDGGGVFVGLHAGKDQVGPPVIFVVVAAAAVGDAVTYDGEGAIVPGGIDFDCREEVPNSPEFRLLTFKKMK
jgi:hypothetical protein